MAAPLHCGVARLRGPGQVAEGRMAWLGRERWAVRLPRAPRGATADCGCEYVWVQEFS